MLMKRLFISGVFALASAAMLATPATAAPRGSRGGYSGRGYSGYGGGYGGYNGYRGGWDGGGWDRGSSFGWGLGLGYGLGALTSPGYYGGYGRGYYGSGYYGNGFYDGGYSGAYAPSYGYYSPGYSGYYSGYSTDMPSYSVSPGATMYSPDTTYAPDTSSSAYAPAAASANTARVTVELPDPNAEVWFNGSPTRQRGATREFVSPAIQPDHDYSYDVRARWNEGGRMVDQTRTVHVQAGGSVMVNFAAADNTGTSPSRATLPPPAPTDRDRGYRTDTDRNDRDRNARPSGDRDNRDRGGRPDRDDRDR